MLLLEKISSSRKGKFFWFWMVQSQWFCIYIAKYVIFAANDGEICYAYSIHKLI